MRDRDRVRLDEGETRFASGTPPRGGGLTRITDARVGLPRRGRWVVMALAATAAILLAAWNRPHDAISTGGAAPEWDIALTSNGDGSVPALVYGKEAGIHFVRIPGAAAAPDEHRRVTARIARGDVYVASLGLRQLRVHTQGAPGSGVLSMSATGRFIRLYQRPSRTGISTGWW